MNTFTITFKNAQGIMVTEDFTLDFISVNSVISWFEDTLGLRVKSISIH